MSVDIATLEANGLLVIWVEADDPTQICCVFVKQLDFESMGAPIEEPKHCEAPSNWLLFGDNEKISRSCTRHLGAACYSFIHTPTP